MRKKIKNLKFIELKDLPKSNQQQKHTFRMLMSMLILSKETKHDLLECAMKRYNEPIHNKAP